MNCDSSLGLQFVVGSLGLLLVSAIAWLGPSSLEAKITRYDVLRSRIFLGSNVRLRVARFLAPIIGIGFLIFGVLLMAKIYCLK